MNGRGMFLKTDSGLGKVLRDVSFEHLSQRKWSNGSGLVFSNDILTKWRTAKRIEVEICETCAR